MNSRQFFAELKRRHVYKVAVAYIVVAWLLIQVASVLFPTFAAPPWVMKVFVTAVLLGFPIALLLAWAFELTPDGIKRADEVPARGKGRKLVSITAALLVLALALLGWQFLRAKENAGTVSAKITLREKSIAVLPFENLSGDPENAFFTDGVQDEILTDLAKVADLKVISRTSVMRYRSEGAPRNLREIGQQLGVANLVEGSVQRSGNKVRVNAQLIDAQTDGHLWAHIFDGPLDDVFAIQSQIAQAIADQLRAHISPAERSTMAQAPTSDVLAFQLYQQARVLEAREASPDAQDDLLRAVDLLGEAIERDPHFLAAFCLLARVQIDLYWEDFDHTQSRVAQAREAIEQAEKIDPDAAETHVAKARYYYSGLHDYDRAVAELTRARQRLPNSADVATLLGAIFRRQGRWDDSIRELAQSTNFDPRNFGTFQQLAFTYTSTRRFREAATYFERALEIVPGEVFTRESLAVLAYYERGDLQPLHALNAAVLAENKPADLEGSAYFRLYTALAERDEASAKAALSVFPARGYQDSTNFFMPREWYAGLTARTFGDEMGARSAFTEARAKLAKAVQDQPDYAEAWSSLGLIDAGLGNVAEAVREGKRGCELLPMSKDAFDGAALAANLAIIYAWSGETEQALRQIESVVRAGGGFCYSGISFGALKRDPQWEPLRGDARFEKFLAELAPKESR